MAEHPRPVSPHLQVYRWQVSNTLSICHRLSGLALAGGAVALIGWLLSLASGQASYTGFIALATSIPGQLLLLGCTFAFFYHLCNGLRHLAWDTGYGFDKAVARRSGLVVVVSAVLLTAVFWLLALDGAAL